MPLSMLSEEEVCQLLSSVVHHGQLSRFENLLASFNISDEVAHLMPNERYLLHLLAFGDFRIRIPYFQDSHDSIDAIQVQFSRPTRFPAPFLNRNRSLVSFLTNTLHTLYSHKTQILLGREYAVPQDVVRSGQLRQFHFGADAPCSFEDSFEDWGSEAAIYDEPNSSGCADPDETDVRNDFVTLRFKRKLA